MGRRGPAVLALLLVVGAAGGFALSRGLAEASPGEGVPEPVAASPAFPLSAGRTPRPDPDDEALQPGIELTEATLGTGRSAITYPAPVGWKPNHLSAGVVKWKKPNTSNNTYVMRVADVRDRDQTVEQAIDATITEMDAKGEEKDFSLKHQRATSIDYTYLSTEGTFRHSFMSMVDLDDDGLVDVEVVVHGREVDAPGAEELVGRVVDGMRLG